MDWSDAVILSLRALWDEGLSTAEIGRRLGVTKNAVVGKAHRLDLPARPSPIRRGVGPAVPRYATGATLPPMEQPGARSPGRDERLALPAPHAPAHADEAIARHSRKAAAAPMPGQAARPSVAATPAPLVPLRATAEPVMAATSFNDEPATPADAPRLAPVRAESALRPAPSPRRSRVVACCWPIGEPGTRSFRFCDAESVAGKPYCDTHAQLAYVKVRDRREDAA